MSSLTRRRGARTGMGPPAEEQKRSDDISVGPSCPRRVPAAGDSPELHVLAVDDSLLDRKVMERLLRFSSYKVTAVDSAKQALEILGLGDKSSQNDVSVNMIITDYCMPEMTGYDLLKRLKESSYLREIPVVIVSSENVPTRIDRCLAEGAKEFLLKPLKLSDVKRLGIHMKRSNRHSDRLLTKLPPMVAARLAGNGQISFGKGIWAFCCMR